MDTTFQERLVAARTNAGMSQAEAAKRLGTSQQAYAKYETGPSLPGFEKLFQMCCLYKVTADYLLGLPERGVSLTNSNNNAVNSDNASIQVESPNCRDCPHLLKLIEILSTK